ncbi:MAG: sigma-70 family RNA polymerase sigma factor [Bacteroidota bacterium]
MLTKNFNKNEILSLFEDDTKLSVLYDRLLSYFKKHVLENSGTLQDAEDLLQESIVLAYRKVRHPDFVLNSSLETFIFGIGKRKWMYELRKIRFAQEPKTLKDESNNIEEMIIKDEKSKLYIEHFKKLSLSCQQVLTLFFQGSKMNEIAEKMNFSSEGYARKRKHQCQNKLIDSIKNDRLYRELSDE